mmetsp:Transcript_16475/g.53964  ORF Transcript_16475/g.53964 Transcript_16475/m.53964 type:complete len:215 (+) Transcript_16475:59-703(+)
MLPPPTRQRNGAAGGEAAADDASRGAAAVPLLPCLPRRGDGGRLLQRLLKQCALAAAPLHPPLDARFARRRGGAPVVLLPGGQRRLLRRRHVNLPDRAGHGVGARLPSDAAAAVPPRRLAKPLHRLVPAHAVCDCRHVPDSAAPRGDPARRARRRLVRLPHLRVRAALHVGLRAGARHRREHGRDAGPRRLVRPRLAPLRRHRHFPDRHRPRAV